VKCPACAHEDPSGIRFCGGGAARVYTPKHLAGKIPQSKSSLEGERKQVSVLFADVKGPMELAGQLDPEHRHAILDRFFAILSGGLHRFEGTVTALAAQAEARIGA
jgi:class 3 adenylate cyclase